MIYKKFPPIPCPECGNLYSVSGLPLHRLEKHRIPRDQSKIVNGMLVSANLAQPVAPPAENIDAVSSEKVQSVSSDVPASEDKKPGQPAENIQEAIVESTNETHDATCPGCIERERLLEQERTRATKAEETAALLQIQKTEAESEEHYEIPDFQTVIAHCESGECEGHKKQFDAFKEQLIAATLDNLPDSIIESEGLKRGFIPKKIIIPGR
ncbi:MAG: hypothetical protein PHG61_08630 [Candidatus Marinimicrobia bacterium]|nr:hypothetical protein [Candidatus Neomarinimicrobiota bacterium]